MHANYKNHLEITTKLTDFYFVLHCLHKINTRSYKRVFIKKLNYLGQAEAILR